MTIGSVNLLSKTVLLYVVHNFVKQATFASVQNHVHLPFIQDLGGFQRQARELIWGPNRGTRAKFLSLNREQSRVVNGLLTGIIPCVGTPFNGVER
jgi:hypothetical protein